MSRYNCQMLLVELTSFALALWLGLYLVQRFRANPGYPALIWTAGGLISYSIALALSAIGQHAPAPLAGFLQQQVAFLIAPLIFWLGALWHLHKARQNPSETAENGGNSAVANRLVILATIFFGLGIGLILAPFELIPLNWAFIAICGDLLLLGYAVGVLDAFSLGENHLPHFLRSALEAEVIASIFGLQIGLIIWLVTGVTFPLVVLLFAVVGSAIVLTVFAGQIQGLFDRWVFGRQSDLQTQRSLLREVSSELPKSTPPTPLALLSADNFTKQTRTALSHLGNLPKLASNPLNQLTLIDQRLSQKGLDNHTLMRAAELKSLLVESIERLKPEETEGFHTTKGWRHYNALYFPYVKGLRPYGRRNGQNHLSVVEKEALAWFDQEVPPRTLYNWQSAAAKIIANDLLERSRKVTSDQ